MVAIVGRKKKDADRVNYNISRSIRRVVLKEADRVNWNEIDMIEELIMFGIATKRLLASGKLSFTDFNEQIEALRDEGKAAQIETPTPVESVEPDRDTESSK